MGRSLTAAVLALVVGAPACSKDDVKPSPRWPEPAGSTSATTEALKPKTDSAVCAESPASVEAPAAEPDAARAFVESLGSASTPLVEAHDPPRVTGMALESTAIAEGNVGKPEGPLKSATLREGERASMPISIAKDACMSFIAQGGLGAGAIDAFVTPAQATSEGEPPRIVAQSMGTGPIAVIGGRAGCVRSPTAGAAFTGELHVRMRRGAGLVLVQIYQR